jgi:hypothetical protein
MDGWNKLSASIASLNIGSSAEKISKTFTSSYQATRYDHLLLDIASFTANLVYRERLGQIPVEDITELPQGRESFILFVHSSRDAHAHPNPQSTRSWRPE